MGRAQIRMDNNVDKIKEPAGADFSWVHGMQEFGVEGLSALPGKIPLLEGEEKNQRQREVLSEVANELENDRRFGSQHNTKKAWALTPYEVVKRSIEENKGNRLKLPADQNAVGFSPQVLEKRNEQTEKVTSMLLTGLPAKEVMELIDEGVYLHETLRPVQVPELRAAELFEAKALLQNLLQHNDDQSGRLARYDQQRGGIGAVHAPATPRQQTKALPSSAYIPEGLPVEMNGPLYSSKPPPRGAFPSQPSPDPVTAARPGRQWL